MIACSKPSLASIVNYGLWARLSRLCSAPSDTRRRPASQKYQGGCHTLQHPAGDSAAVSVRLQDTNIAHDPRRIPEQIAIPATRAASRRLPAPQFPWIRPLSPPPALPVRPARQPAASRASPCLPTVASSLRPKLGHNGQYRPPLSGT
jgi:hypothetical protein